MITVDTSGLFAWLDRREKHHAAVRDALLVQRTPYLVPAAILSELAYLVERTLGDRAMDAFLEDVEKGRFTLDCGDRDITRVRELMQRYDDLPLGFADSAVIACAERHGGHVLTLDHRHFGIVSQDAGLTLFPA